MEGMFPGFHSLLIGPSVGPTDARDPGCFDRGDQGAYTNLSLRTGEIKDLTDETAMDVITMWHYLEHDYNPQKHLKQLLKVAHSNTKLIVEVPNFDSYTRRKFGKFWSGYHTPRHTALYSPNNIALLLENSGWSVSSSGG